MRGRLLARDDAVQRNHARRTGNFASHVDVDLASARARRLGQANPYATVPPRVDYQLTNLGRSLTDPLAILARWAGAHRGDIDCARAAYDQARESAA